MKTNVKLTHDILLSQLQEFGLNPGHWYCDRHEPLLLVNKFDEELKLKGDIEKRSQKLKNLTLIMVTNVS